MIQKTSISLLALAVASLTASPAMAEPGAAAAPAAPAPDLAAPGDQQQSQDDIIVTGTRSTGLKVADSPAPIQVLSSESLKTVGQTDLMSALAQQLPQIQQQGFGNDQTAFHPSIKLRGLNPNHTLILINGKRRHGTANVVVTNTQFTGGAAPDIGLIPEDSIDHIEVLQDGAAAQYGTDAIAGVINFILKKNDHGGVINGTLGQYMDGDGFTYDIQGNIGIAPIEDMFLSITAERKFHDFSFRGDVDPRVVDTGQAGAANTGNNGGRTILARYPGVKTFSNYPYVNRIFGDGKMNLTTAMYNFGYDGIPNIEIYSFGSYSRRVGFTNQNYRLPNVVYGKSAQASVNTANPTGDIPFPNGFSPQEVLRETDFAATGGVKGTFGGTTADLSLTYGKDFDAIYVENSSNAALYYDSSTLTQPGYSPRDVHDGDFVASQLTANLDLTHKLDIGLDSPVTLAGGLEYRRENYQLRAGEVASYYVGTGFLGGGIQSFFGYAPSNASSHDRTNYSEYFDVSVKPVSSVFVEGSVRHENYSDFGDATIFRGTGRWDITPAFAIRGTASTGFRAPSLAEEYYSGINVSVASLSGIFAPNSSGAALLGIGGLKPEKSTNFSVGVVARPIPKLVVTLDAYSIYLRDRIVQSSGFTGYSNNCKYLPNGYTTGTNTAAAKAAFNGTCTGFISPSVLDALNANGVPIASVINVINGGATGSLAVNTFVNGLKTLTRGIDFLATYPIDLDNLGKIDLSVAANYNETKVKGVGLPPPLVNQAQGLFDVYSQSSLTDTTPKIRLTFAANWNIGIFNVNLRESIYGASQQLATTPANANINYYYRVTRKAIIDLSVSAHPSPAITLSAGANNLFNTYPNKYPQYIRDQQYAISSTAYVSQYPSFSPIGINGGYYYGRVSIKF